MKANSTTPAPAHTWISDAACIEDDPRDYDVDAPFLRALSEKQLDSTYAWQRITNLKCTACPVAHLCAADTLHHKDIEVFRGGLPMFSRHSRGPSLRRIIEPLLHRVAAGESVEELQTIAFGALLRYVGK
ncbi:hypothetical protein FRC0474_01997 [Corynebacterium diphtheriae]|nr:hypothetical protein FRC0026_01758 [Corynebacterium diphtheriae]CAB0810278.1 hypothetical protein FRC0201_01771 [Corynebacterium diphtheriae]CAB0970486.1 hypothetical protein FRC0474_01997 [Corynebacterium diphtheriae]